MQDTAHDVEINARLTRLEAGSRLVRMKTTKNLKQANWLKANARQLRSNPVADDIFGGRPPLERRRS